MELLNYIKKELKMKNKCCYVFNDDKFYCKLPFCVKDKCVGWDEENKKCIFELYDPKHLIWVAKSFIWLCPELYEANKKKDNEKGERFGV